MAVYKHKNGRWYTRFQIRGKRYHEAIPEATDKRTAENAETKIKAELLSGRFDLIENKKQRTFFELCEKFEEYAVNNRKNYAKDKGMVTRFKNFYGNCLLSDFDTFSVERYRTKRRNAKKKPATINKEVGILRRMFNIAMDNSWMSKNPALKRHVKPMPVENTEKRIITPAEERKLLAACTGECAYLKPIIICALHSGMRKSEILNLEWKNVDLDNRIITILIQKNRKKSYIPMSETLTRELTKLYQQKSSKYVFVNPITNLPYVNIRNNYNKILTQAGITDFTFHSLRHTACTRLLEQGVPVDVVKEIMRHSNVEITLEVYNHINQSRKFEAIKALESYGK